MSQKVKIKSVPINWAKIKKEYRWLKKVGVVLKPNTFNPCAQLQWDLTMIGMGYKDFSAN